MTPVEPTAEPDLSVVMVTRGAWSLTERALEALRDHTDCRLELIVVDNDSRDETRTLLAGLPGARVLLNDDNVGFGPACNQGAEVAQGELLLLLNPDAFVEPGWLEPMRDALRNPAVGAVVPRYLHPDGSLQEAGALLAQDGTVIVYGDGEDPAEPSYCFRRIVDFGAAACMLIRRELFDSLEGFDPRYAPAYYDDTDLCMRVAERGLSVLYEPRATVTHVRYGAGGVDAAIRLSEGNRGRFVERWGPSLVGRPHTFIDASEQATIVARDAVATPRVVLAAGPEEEAAAGIARALLDGWARARITWAGDWDGRDSQWWLDSGVEALAGVDWIHDRLFHYDVVFLGERADPGVAVAIRQTQPHAPEIDIAELDGIHGLHAAMCRAGVAPAIA